jgi:hypothetical protein
VDPSNAEESSYVSHVRVFVDNFAKVQASLMLLEEEVDGATSILPKMNKIHKARLAWTPRSA